MDMLRLHGLGGAVTRATQQLIITPGTQDIIEPGGNYMKGIKVPGEPNLIAANLVAGKSYYGIQGGATIGSLGGKRVATGIVSLSGGPANGTQANTTLKDSFTISLDFKPSILIVSINGFTNINTNNNARTYEQNSPILYIGGNIGTTYDLQIAENIDYINTSNPLLPSSVQVDENNNITVKTLIGYALSSQGGYYLYRCYNQCKWIAIE